jgi:L-2,4-diaminobutyrate decarboxylase
MNQNLLHPDTGEAGRRLEEAVIGALAPVFGMAGGQQVPGSTVANLTALWAAREVAGAKEIVASELAHLSIEKSAHLLGLGFRKVPVDADGRLERERIGDVSGAAVVLTAGTTGTGSIDPLGGVPSAAWVHVDAAWAGPLQLSARHRGRLEGIEAADSIAVSAHKWLWQPKDSALILLSDWERAKPAISFGGAYLAAPNVGVLGSSAARALPLAATLMSLGRDGIEARIDRCMAIAEELAGLIAADARLELWGRPQSGVIAWRRRGEAVEATRARLAARGIRVSETRIAGEAWLRSVAIHPDIDAGAAYRAAST